MSDLVLGIRLTADGKDLVGAVKVSAAEIDKMAGSTKRAGSEAEKLNAQQKHLGDQFNRTGGASGLLAQSMDRLAGMVKIAAASFGLFKSAQWAKDATMLSARYETLGIVMRVAGNNAGYTGAQMGVYAKQLQASGISMQQSRLAVVNLATANIDLANASKLGRAAQDLAVVGQINSSEALGRLVYGLKSGQVEVLRTLGLNVNFESGYKKLAAQIGTTSDKLTEKQKMLARTNVALAEAARYEGIYEESMTTAGKAMTSLTRYWEDFKTKAGDVFLPTLARGVFGLTDALKAANTQIDAISGDGSIRRWGREIADAAGTGAKGVMQTIAALYQHRDAVAAVAGAYASWRVATWLGPLISKTYESAAAASVHMAAVVSGNSAHAIALKLEAQRAAALAADAAQTLASATAATARTAALVAEANAQRAMAAEIMLFGPQRAAIERGVTAAVVAHTAAVQAQAIAETRATAATSAHAAAMAAASVSARAAAAGSALLSGALLAMGGPIGAITLALGVGATAWALWGSAAKNAGNQAQTAIENALIIAKRYRDEARFGTGDVGALKAGLAALDEKMLALSLPGKQPLNAAEQLKALRIEWLALANALNQAAGTGSSEQGRSAAEQARIAAAAASRAATEADERRNAAAEEARKATEKYSKAYNALISSIQEKTALDALESQGVRKLSDAEKLAAKTMVELRDGTLKLTDAQKINLASKLEGMITADKLNTQEKTAFEARAKAEKEYLDTETKNAFFLETLERAKTDALISAKENIKQMEFETTLIGVSNAERERAIALRALETSGIDKQSGEYADLQTRLETALASKHAAQAMQDQIDATKAAAKQMSDEVNRGLTDSIYRGFEAGKDFGKNFFDSLVNMAKTTVLRPVIQWAVSPLSGAITAALGGMGIPGIASASGGAGAAGGAGGTLGGLGNLFSSGATGVTGLANGVFQNLGVQFGSQWIADIGNYGFGLPFISGLAMAASGNVAGGIGSTLGGIAGSYFGPIGTVVGSALGAKIGSMFGGGDERQAQVIGAGVEGRIGRGGLQGNLVSFLGTGPNDRWGGGALSPIAANALSTINNSIDQLFTNMEKAARSMGLAVGDLSSVMVDFTASSQNGDQVQNDLTAALNSTADAIAERLMPNIRALQLNGETLAQTFGRLAAAQAALDAQRRTMEIRLMELQGDALGALAARRKDELAALDPTLRALQEQIYAAEDLAKAMEAAAVPVVALADALRGLANDALGALRAAIDAQSRAASAASATAHQAADAFRQIAASIVESVRQLRGGDLSPLLPADKLSEARANLSTAYGKGQAGDAAALSALPQLANDFLSASRAYNASSQAYSADFAWAMDMLAKASEASTAAAVGQNHAALTADAQLVVLESISNELSKPSPDAAILNEQLRLLASISTLSDAQLQSLVSSDVTQGASLGDIGAGIDTIGVLMQQWITLQGQASAAAKEAAEKAAADQANAIAAAKAAADAAIAKAAESSLIASATAAFQSQKAFVDTARVARDEAVQNLGVSQAPAPYTQEDLSQGTAGGYAYFTYVVGQEALVSAAKAANRAYIAEVAKAYDLWKAIPGHAAGLDYVPRDDYLMRAHEGEAVLTAPQAAAWRSGEAGITGSDLAAMSPRLRRSELVSFSAPGRVNTVDQPRDALSAPGDNKQWRDEQSKLARETLAATQESADRQVAALRAGLATLQEEFASLLTELRRLTA